MRWLRNLSIRRKLMAIIMLTTGAALLLASVAWIVSDQLRARADLVRDLDTIAAILADNSTAAVAFSDQPAAADTLSALHAMPNVEAACIYDLDGVIAEFIQDADGPGCPALPGNEGVHSESDSLSVVRPIVLGNRGIGTLYIRSDLREISQQLDTQILTSLAVLVGAGAIALLISSWLQQTISRPIRGLARTMQAVSDHNDYSLRAALHGSDEMGRLAESFNLMLTQIEERDARLRAAKAELESRVRERTEELGEQLAETQRAQQELIEVNVELIQSNKELDDFAYIASHDLKEPLRGISSYAGFLLEDYGEQLNLEARGRLETVMRLSQRMDGLIDTLLHYSQVGRLELVRQRVDLNAVLGEVVDSLAVRLAGVEVRIPRPLPVEYCDRTRVGEVFQNLITNAVKYNDKPEKLVEIGVVESGGGRIYYVRDNGIGIPSKHQEAIFRIFKRLHSREKFGGGTGAGLTIVRKIIERHNGKLWLESMEGTGTTFFFTLSRTG